MNKKTLNDVDVNGKRVLLRCDFNVPMQNGSITDDKRITAALPTIEYLLEKGAKVVVCSHLGRPKGEFNMKYSLRPVAARLNEYLGNKVSFASDVIGPDAVAKAKELANGEALLLENLRFHREEEANDRDFAAKLASYGDIYVNDAFGTAHRAHASTAGVVTYGFIETAVAGFLIAKELEVMGAALEKPVRPFVAVLGGAKVSDKIGVIDNLIDKADTIIIGGGMAFTFFKARGYEIGNSLCENDKLEMAKQLMEKAAAKEVKMLLPLDVAVIDAFPDPVDKKVDFAVFPADQMPAGKMGGDIGPETVALFRKEIARAKTVIWNGPMGIFENPVLSAGTKEVAEALAASEAVTIVGGGDSAAAVEQMGLAAKMTHISTGGGASLEYLEGKILPGVQCLNDK